MLNVHRLKTSTKDSIGRMVPKKHDPTICFLQETHFKYKVKGWKRVFHENYRNRAGAAILTNKDFKTKNGY